MLRRFLPAALIVAVLAPPAALAASAKPRTATPAARGPGAEWLATAAARAGGPAAWAAVRAVRIVSTDKATVGEKTLEMRTTTSWRLPDRLVSVQKLAFGELKVGFDGTHGWSSVGPKVSDMPAIGDDVASEWRRSLFHLFGHPDTIVLAAAEAPRMIDSVTYRVAVATPAPGQDVTLFFGPDGSLARTEYTGNGPAGSARLTEIFSDWRTVGAIRWPYRRQVLTNGTPYLDSTIDTLELDPVLDDATFRQPGS